MVFTLLIFLSSPIFHIVGLFLSLGPFAKMGINIQPPEHMNYSYGSYMNQKKKKRFFFNSGSCLIFFLVVNSVVSLNFPIY